jgi:hypothetical protein
MKGKERQTNVGARWLTAWEVALRLQVDDSRVRQILIQDQKRPQEMRRFPSARKALPGEEQELRQSRRIKRAPASGVWLIAADEVESVQEKGRRLLGRPPKWEYYYAGCAWFSGRKPAEEALTWACAGDEDCCAAMLSAQLKSFYERCIPTAVCLDGVWVKMEAKAFTEALREAYEGRSCGKIAYLTAAFHDQFGVALVVRQAERHFARSSDQ